MSTPRDAEVPRIPELVGATSSPFRLHGPLMNVSLAVEEPSGPASRRAAELANWAPRRVFLNIEKMLSENGAPPVYVYLNLPPLDSPAAHPELFAGELPMFGLREASVSDASHTPTGLYEQLDITALYARLALMKDWDPRNLRITFAPRYGGNLPPLHIDRVSLYFA
jgi:tyrosinase